jgi:hypothetical protein
MIKLTAIALVAAYAVVHPTDSDQWSATLVPTNESTVSGTATAESGIPDSTRLKISIRGAEPNATLPWHIHNGACGSAGEVLGSGSAYPALQVSGGGTAEATVTLAIRPSKTGSYAVQVHKGTAAPDKPGSDVISCGDLKPVMNKMPSN